MSAQHIIFIGFVSRIQPSLNTTVGIGHGFSRPALQSRMVRIIIVTGTDLSTCRKVFPARSAQCGSSFARDKAIKWLSHCFHSPSLPANKLQVPTDTLATMAFRCSSKRRE